MALCSLSTGSRTVPWRFTAAITTSPAATRTSLFANAICFPCSMALYVAGRPTTPTAAETTISASGWVATRSRPSGPNSTSGIGRLAVFAPVRVLGDFSAAHNSRAPASVATDTTDGRNFTDCSIASLMFEPAAIATTWNFPGWASTTSRVWRPMEPVEPSMEMRFIWLYFIGVRAIMRTEYRISCVECSAATRECATRLRFQIGEFGVLGGIGEAFEPQAVAVGIGETGHPHRVSYLRF